MLLMRICMYIFVFRVCILTLVLALITVFCWNAHCKVVSTIKSCILPQPVKSTLCGLCV